MLHARARPEHAPGFCLSCPALQCVAVCCSVLQCVAVCCSALQCVAVRCKVLQKCVAVCCSVLQCVAECCSVCQGVAEVCCRVFQCVAVLDMKVLEVSVLRCLSTWCVALCIALCIALCSMLQFVTVCRRVMHESKRESCVCCECSVPVCTVNAKRTHVYTHGYTEAFLPSVYSVYSHVYTLLYCEFVGSLHGWSGMGLQHMLGTTKRAFSFFHVF